MDILIILVVMFLISGKTELCSMKCPVHGKMLVTTPLKHSVQEHPLFRHCKKQKSTVLILHLTQNEMTDQMNKPHKWTEPYYLDNA